MCNRGGDGGHLARLAAVGAISHNQVSPGNGNIGKRQAIDIDAEFEKIGSDQTCSEPGRSETLRTVAIVDRSVGRPGRIGRPLRRSKALDPPALLVDQDRSWPAEDIAHLADQAPQLIGRSGVAPKNNQTPRLRRAEKVTLGIG